MNVLSSVSPLSPTQNINIHKHFLDIQFENIAVIVYQIVYPDFFQNHRKIGFVIDFFLLDLPRLFD